VESDAADPFDVGSREIAGSARGVAFVGMWLL